VAALSALCHASITTRLDPGSASAKSTTLRGTSNLCNGELPREIRDPFASAERLAYSPEEAADLLGISRELVHDLLRTGQLGSRKAGRRRLISKHHLEEFLAAEQ
jgi:excisionase family DNA binding protein